MTDNVALHLESQPEAGRVPRYAEWMKQRCSWVPEDDSLYTEYHDTEWGVPSHDDHHLFEMITLEGAQAGLSWRTILARREGYRMAFVGFDPTIVQQFDHNKVDELLTFEGVIRHRGKIESTVSNASCVRSVQEEFGSLDAYVWSFVGGTTIVNRWTDVIDSPAETDQSRALSQDMKRRGFRFVGPITMYAFMQAAGLVDDHSAGCFRS